MDRQAAKAELLSLAVENVLPYGACNKLSKKYKVSSTAMFYLAKELNLSLQKRKKEKRDKSTELYQCYCGAMLNKQDFCNACKHIDLLCFSCGKVFSRYAYKILFREKNKEAWEFNKMNTYANDKFFCSKKCVGRHWQSFRHRRESYESK